MASAAEGSSEENRNDLKTCLDRLHLIPTSNKPAPKSSIRNSMNRRNRKVASAFRDKLKRQKERIVELRREIDDLKERKDKTKKDKERIKELALALKDLLPCHVEIKCSDWTIDMMEKYISEISSLLLLEDSVDEFWPEIIKGHRKCDTSVRGEEDRSFIEALSHDNYDESTVSDFVKNLLDLLVPNKGMLRPPPQTINYSELPSCRPDITIVHEKDESMPAGLVEIKAPGRLVPKSVVQCMVQLLVIHALNDTYGLFGIITDYCQFVFIMLTEDGQFQIHRKTHKWETLDELKKICGLINGLLNVVKEKREAADRSPRTNDPQHEQGTPEQGKPGDTSPSQGEEYPSSNDESGTQSKEIHDERTKRPEDELGATAASPSRKDFKTVVKEKVGNWFRRVRTRTRTQSEAEEQTIQAAVVAADTSAPQKQRHRRKKETSKK